jgi:hypothetical protein
MGLRFKEPGCQDKYLFIFEEAPKNAKIIPPKEEQPVATQYFN